MKNTKTEYERANDDLIAAIKRMEKETDPATVHAVDIDVSTKLAKLRSLLKTP
jgi:hypothetical protein